MNRTNGAVLAEEYGLCSSVMKKARGLMFSRQRSLVFPFDSERIVPLHMLFVFYPIDVLFLDKDKRVAEIKENFRPFTFYTPKQRAKYVIELPAGVVSETHTKTNDYIDFS